MDLGPKGKIMKTSTHGKKWVKAFLAIVLDAMIRFFTPKRNIMTMLPADINDQTAEPAPVDQDLVNILVIVQHSMLDAEVMENMAGLLGLVYEDILVLQNRLHAYMEQAPGGTPDAEKYGEDYLNDDDQEPDGNYPIDDELGW